MSQLICRWIGLLVFVCLVGAARADTISGVVFTGSPADPTVYILGSGFGTAPTPTTVAYPGFTGYDYGDSLYFEDVASGHGFQAGYGFAGTTARDYIGLVLDQYTDDLIEYTLGSAYASYYYPLGIYQLQPGDSFFLHTDADFSGTVVYSATAPTVTPEPESILLVASGFFVRCTLTNRENFWGNGQATTRR